MTTLGVGTARYLLVGKKNQIPGIVSVFVTKKLFLGGVENWKPQCRGFTFWPAVKPRFNVDSWPLLSVC